jgi:HK97 family phage major capsid protein
MAGAETPTEQEQPQYAAKTFGQQIIESRAYKTAVASVGSRFSSSADIDVKVAGTVAEGTTVSGGFLNGVGGALAVPEYRPGIVDLKFAPLSVAQLFSQGTTNAAIISYVRQTAETIGAAAVAEGATKPQIDATVARLNEQVGKIAGWYKITDEMLQDVSYIQSFLTNHLIGQIQRYEENAVLNGTGYPSINGILGRSGMQTTISGGTTGTIAAAVNKFGEAIFQQVTAIRFNSFLEPDAVVMNPIDWQYLRLAKDANTQYYSGGPFTGAYGTGGYSNVEALWGLRVVLSPRITSGTALVGAFAEAGQLVRRTGISVEMANQNQDDFINNLILVRAEERAALIVTRPEAFGKVTVTWA